MDLRYLERRNDPRRPAYIPVTFHVAGLSEESPAHLLDLSSTGAAMLTTSRNAPMIGMHLNLHFESPNNDGGASKRHRIEPGIVVNSSSPDRDITRIGVRFIESPDMGSGLRGPHDDLTFHKKPADTPGICNRRWQTARNFEKTGRPLESVGA